MFGLMHILNGLFGPGLDAGLSQGVITFFVGTAFYLYRRRGLHLAIPMMVHVLWDFSVFANSTSGASTQLVIAVTQIGIAVLSVALVTVVLFMDRAKHQEHLF